MNVKKKKKKKCQFLIMRNENKITCIKMIINRRSLNKNNNLNAPLCTKVEV